MTTPMSDDNTSPVDPADFAQATAGAVLVGNQLADARKPLLPARAGSIAKVPSREGARTPGKKITMPMNITDAEIEVQSTYRTEGANDDIPPHAARRSRRTAIGSRTPVSDRSPISHVDLFGRKNDRPQAPLYVPDARRVAIYERRGGPAACHGGRR